MGWWEGVQYQPWVLGSLMYGVVKLERGETNKKQTIELTAASGLLHHLSAQQMNAAGSQEELCSETHSSVLLKHVPPIPFENIFISEVT